MEKQIYVVPSTEVLELNTDCCILNNGSDLGKESQEVVWG